MADVAQRSFSTRPWTTGLCEACVFAASSAYGRLSSPCSHSSGTDSRTSAYRSLGFFGDGSHYHLLGDAPQLAESTADAPLRRQDRKDQGSVRRSSSRTGVACKDRLGELNVADWKRCSAFRRPKPQTQRSSKRRRSSAFRRTKPQTKRGSKRRRSSAFRRAKPHTKRGSSQAALRATFC